MKRLLDALLGRFFAVAGWLILPIALFLFLQWPLRDLVRVGSREVNDTGQILFAVYVALSVAAAARAGVHLTPGNLAGRYPGWLRRLIGVLGEALAVVPWLVFLAWAGWPVMRSALGSLERFQDSGNPGYFLIKLALGVLVVTLLAASVLAMMGASPKSKPDQGPGEHT